MAEGGACSAPLTKGAPSKQASVQKRTLLVLKRLIETIDHLFDFQLRLIDLLLAYLDETDGLFHLRLQFIDVDLLVLDFLKDLFQSFDRFTVFCLNHWSPPPS